MEETTVRKEASNEQIKELLLKFTKIFLDIVGEKKKILSLDCDRTQTAIHMDSQVILARLIRWVNSGCKTGLTGVVDLISPPTLSFRDTTLKERSGFKGYHSFELLKSRVIAISKLHRGEPKISFTCALKRAKGGVTLNSNFLSYILENQDDEKVQNFFNQFDEKSHLYCFGDCFETIDGLFVFGTKKDLAQDKWKYIINYLQDTFDQDCFSLELM